MSDKSEQILKKLKRRDRKGLRRLSKVQANPKRIEQILSKLNSETMDSAAPVAGGEKESKFLKEMNEFEVDHDQFMESLRNSRLGTDQ